MEPFIGEVRLLPYSFAPRGWMLCNGQILPISSNTTLFSIIGTVYGGNGTTTFALPNLQGCVVPGTGTGPGLQPWSLGMEEGSQTVTLVTNEMPSHTHGISGLDVIGDTDVPSATSYLGLDRRGGQTNINFLAPSDTPLDTFMAPEALTNSGGSQSHENRQPFLALNFCIAVTGIFPQRN